MSPRTARRACALLLGAGVVLASAPARADRLALVGGGTIEVARWWVEGDTLFYEDDGGTVGLPRSLVARVEAAASAGGAPRPQAGAPTPPPAPAPASSSRLTPHSAERSPGPKHASRATVEQLDQAFQAYAAHDYARAAGLFRDLLDHTEPELVEPRVGYALAQIQLDEDEAARSVVLDVLAREPRQPQMLEILGDLEDRAEHVPDALRAYRDAFAIAPNDRLREKILRVERELHAGRDFELSMSSHFNVRFDGELDAALGEAVTQYLEERYPEMVETFDHAPRQAITVVLYPTQQFRDVTLVPEWVGGLYDGKIRVPLGGLERLDAGARALLMHELTHAFVHAKSRGQCPRWLHEGLAQRFEGRRLTTAQREALVPRLHKNDPARWEEDGFSYPLALSLTSFLEEQRGLDGLLRVVAALGDGHELDTALVEVYGAPYVELCRDWATAVLAVGGR